MISLTHGFLPSTPPLQSLPSNFAAWESVAAKLPKLLVSHQCRQEIEALPSSFPLELLQTSAQNERAMMILSYIGHAYVWGEKPVANRLPANIAKAWCSVAQRLKRPPVLSYASYALHNWYLINPSEPIVLGNIALLQNFLGGMDEEWFILIHVDIEEKAKTALQALFPVLDAAQKKSSDEVFSYLRQIADSLEAMCTTLDRMPERCDPYIYYHRVRPYIHAWKNNPALPDGLIYEDCFDNKPQQFRGETGAQSSIIPALDHVLGITHQKDELRVYLQEMRDYMPFEHRAFLDDLEKLEPVRTFVARSHDERLKTVYNQCVDLITRFRSTHLLYASKYIHKQSQDSSANPHAIGTGGTPFMKYLSKHEKETEEHKL